MKDYVLGKLPSDENKDNQRKLRELLSLPKTKKLVYFQDFRDDSSVIDVEKVKIEKRHDYVIKKQFETIEKHWYAITVFLSNGEKHRMHNDFFVDMQKPGFVERYISIEKEEV